jgi:hypothetical protein
MVSIGVEGDWASHLNQQPSGDAAQAAAAEGRYRARMLADGNTAGEAGGSGSREAADVESDSGASEDLEDVDTTLAAFQERVGVWPEQVCMPGAMAPAKILPLSYSTHHSLRIAVFQARAGVWPEQENASERQAR